MIFIPKKWSAWGEPKAEPDGKLAGRQGFEPRYADPESAVLPLDDLPAGKANPHLSATVYLLQLPPDRGIIESPEEPVPKAFGQFRDLGKHLRGGGQVVL